MTSVLRKNAAMTAHEKPTVGDSKISFVSIDHLGWLRCDGRRLPIEGDYGLLYKVIGTTFGGDATHFNLPDASGVVPGISSPAYPTGTLVGEYEHILTIEELPAHNHDASGGQLNTDNGVVPTAQGRTNAGGQHSHNLKTANDDFNFTSGSWPASTSPQAGMFSASGTKDSGASGIANMTWTGGTTDSTQHIHNIASNGGGVAHNNMQPTLFIGNLFIYCGDPTAGSWPYTQGTNIY